MSITITMKNVTAVATIMNTNIIIITTMKNVTVDAMTITFITVILSVFGGMLICTVAPVSFLDGWYEAVSAICTVGLSAAGTATLGVVSQCMIIAFMYFGRVGILTLSLGFLMGNRAKDRFQYADTNLLIG